MEANLCNLDSNVLLPPRKRLLAGLKKQNSDGNPHKSLTSGTLSEFDIRLNNLLRSNFNNPNTSLEEAVEASRSAAAAAVKAAGAARAAAEGKALIAAKAIAAAKSALDLVATVPGTSKGRYTKKNRMKKQVPVNMLYNKHRHVENSKTDEELAQKLHRAINSSPRISRSSSTSELKSSKHKRLKGVNTLEKTRVSNGVISWEGNRPSTSNGNGMAGKVDTEGSVAYTVRVDQNTSKFNKADRLKMGHAEAERSHPKEKMTESSDDTCSIGRKRGRIKQKKLPLTICSFRDLANPKEELKSESSSSAKKNKGQATLDNVPLFSVQHPDGLMPVETTPIWKCQAIKAPECVKRSKVIES